VARISQWGWDGGESLGAESSVAGRHWGSGGEAPRATESWRFVVGAPSAGRFLHFFNKNKAMFGIFWPK